MTKEFPLIFMRTHVRSRCGLSLAFLGNCGPKFGFHLLYEATKLRKKLHVTYPTVHPALNDRTDVTRFSQTQT
jgi:hypothetical protein